MILAKRSLLIGTFGLEQTAPALAARGHPRLTKAGNRPSPHENVSVIIKPSTKAGNKDAILRLPE
jgi:hypothetical protein